MLLSSDDVNEAHVDVFDELDVTDPSIDEGIILGDVSSLHSLSGTAQPRSLRLWGNTLKQRYQVMIDNGSTHNFITPTLAERLKLSLTPIPCFRVYIGNGDSIPWQHKCTAVPITLQDTLFTLDLFVLPIKGPDIILGIQWLQELGKVTHDYRSSCMEFDWQGQRVVLLGDNSLSSRQVTFSMMMSIVQSDELAAIYEVWLVGAEPPSTLMSIDLQHIPQPFHDVLTEFQAIFDEPRDLPPYRMFDHRIHLEAGSKPVNVRPYRYPYF